MLDEITARNLGLIEKAAVSLSPGLTVITGETGTGKTLMLGALRLLRGDKAKSGYVGPFGDTCEVAARFGDDTTELIARRTVGKGRSRAYVNDVAASAAALAQEVGSRVMIVGQHDQLTITTSAGIRNLVDSTIDSTSVVSDFDEAWNRYQSLLAEAEALGGDPRVLERDLSMAEYQADEIDKAALGPDEDTALAEKLAVSRNAEAISVHLDNALSALGDDGTTPHLDAALKSLAAAAAVDTRFTPIADRLTDLSIELADIAGDAAVLTSSLESDPAALQQLEERQAEINALKRKYGESIDDITAFGEAARNQADTLRSMLEASADIEDRVQSADTLVRRIGSELLTARAAAGEKIASAAELHLKDLGFKNPRVIIDVTASEPTASGTDRLTLLFASDASLDPAPVSAIASGGELSRLVLALTLAAGVEDASVVAFDEVDAGVGGATALAMGQKLASLAQDRQVVCVTHLPQVAAFADVHVAVERQGTTAVVTPITGEERVVELSRMLAGMSDSTKGQEHATELLELAGHS